MLAGSIFGAPMMISFTLFFRTWKLNGYMFAFEDEIANPTTGVPRGSKVAPQVSEVESAMPVVVASDAEGPAASPPDAPSVVLEDATSSDVPVAPSQVDVDTKSPDPTQEVDAEVKAEVKEDRGERDALAKAEPAAGRLAPLLTAANKVCTSTRFPHTLVMRVCVYLYSHTTFWLYLFLFIHSYTYVYA